MNELLFIVSIPAVFSAVVLIGKFFGKSGLITYTAVASVIANIITAKQITIFGFDATMGTILFSSEFFATDIICESYGKKTANNAVIQSSVFVIGFLICACITRIFIPNSFDYVSDSLDNVFGFSARVSAASVLMFFLSNMADVYIFDRLKKRFPNKLWIRNNVATILCNCAENFCFVMLAFVGVYRIEECVNISVTTSMIEIIVALLDTPFVYIGRKVSKKERNEQ